MAWVTERKGLLSGLFFLLSVGVYVGYGAARSPWPATWRVMSLFALGLMAKPMVVTLPFVLLLLDWWPLGRFGEGWALPTERRGRGWAPPTEAVGWAPPTEAVVRTAHRGRRWAPPTETSKPDRNSVGGRCPPYGLLVEKLPLLVLAAISCVKTVVVQRDAMPSLDQLSLVGRGSAMPWFRTWPTLASFSGRSGWPCPILTRAMGWPLRKRWRPC